MPPLSSEPDESPVKPGMGGQCGGQGGEEGAEEANGLRAALLIGREGASSLHFGRACVRSRGDVRTEFVPLSRHHHHPGACLVRANGGVREAGRRRPRGGVGILNQILPGTVNAAVQHGMTAGNIVRVRAYWLEQLLSKWGPGAHRGPSVGCRGSSAKRGRFIPQSNRITVCNAIFSHGFIHFLPNSFP